MPGEGLFFYNTSARVRGDIADTPLLGRAQAQTVISAESILFRLVQSAGR